MLYVSKKKAMLFKGESSNYFQDLGAEIIKKGGSLSTLTYERRFRKFFGVHWDHAYRAWGLIVDLGNLPRASSGKHLLWALLHLKTYASKCVLASICECDEKTYRKWSNLIRIQLTLAIDKKVRIFLVDCHSFSHFPPTIFF